MDPLTRFNMAREARRGARPDSVTVRAWPPTAPAEDDEDWDAVIARAKRQAASLPRATRPPQPAPPTHLPPELQVTPPPVPVPQAPTASMGRPPAQRIRTGEQVRAKLDVIVWAARTGPLRCGLPRAPIERPRRTWLHRRLSQRVEAPPRGHGAEARALPPTA